MFNIILSKIVIYIKNINFIYQTPLLVPLILLASLIFFKDATKDIQYIDSQYEHLISNKATVASTESIHPKQFYNKKTYKHQVVITNQHKLNYNLIWYSHSPTPLTLPGYILHYSGQYIPLYPNANNFGFNYRQYLLRRNINAIVKTKIKNIQILKREPNILGTLEHIRYKFQNLLFHKMPIKEASVINALLTGNRNFIDEQTKNIFINTGTAHLLAISGLHLALIASLLYWLLGWILPYYKHRIPIVICVIIVLMAFSGSHPPVVRAGLMVILVALAFLVKRPVQFFNILCASLIITLLIWPYQLFNTGLYLSYGAVMGIVLSINYYNPSSFFGRLMVVSTSAWLWTMPIILFTFNSFQIFSPICNLVIVPIFSVFLTIEIVLIIIALCTGFTWAWYLIAKVCTLFLLLVHNINHILPPSIFLPPPNAILVVSFLLGILLFLQHYKKGIIISLISVLIYLPWGLGFLSSSANQIIFLNVGVGDSTLLTSNKKIAVIDCGGFKNATQNALLHRGFTEIEYLFLTHSDMDHIKNIKQLMQNFKIKTLVLPRAILKTSLIKYIIKKSPKTIYVSENDLLNFEKFKIRILNPPYKIKHKITNNNENNYSIAMLISHKNKPLIFLGGDIETKSKKRLLNKYALLLHKIKIFKAPHHGRNSIRDKFFIRKIKPKNIIINGITNKKMNTYLIMFNHNNIINTRFTGETDINL